MVNITVSGGFQEKIYIELWMYWFDTFTIGLLSPKFQKREIRIIPGFCDPNIEKEGENRLDVIYGGEISNLIQEKVKNDLYTGVIVQTANIDWKRSLDPFKLTSSVLLLQFLRHL